MLAAPLGYYLLFSNDLNGYNIKESGHEAQGKKKNDIGLGSPSGVFYLILPEL